MNEPTTYLPPPIQSSKEVEATTSSESNTDLQPLESANVKRYVMGTLIARGGMGEIYRATDYILKREVAIKVLQSKFHASSITALRFAEEARITGQLQHPNIPAVHDLGTLPDGRPFLTMKLIKGETLDEILKKRNNLLLEHDRLMIIFEGICQAVAYAHSHGVIHRDLKPQNIMVGRYGEVQVMDWGLAKVIQDHVSKESDPEATTAHSEIMSDRESDEEKTKVGTVLGTPAYMPPEQAIGAIDQIDCRSDVFGLGAILAVVLTGKPPFVSSNSENTRQLAAMGKVHDCFMRLDESPFDAALVRLCKRCLNPDKWDRPKNADEVATAVASIRMASLEFARLAELEQQKARIQVEEYQKRQRVLRWTSGSIGLVLLVGMIGTTYGLMQAKKQTTAKVKALEAETQANDDLWSGLDVMTSNIVGNSLGTQKFVSVEQKAFLGNVLPLYEKLSATKESDETIRNKVAQAAFRIGLIEYRIGRIVSSIAAFEKARDVYQQLVAEYQDNPLYQSELARCLNNLGDLYRDQAELAKAEQNYLQGQNLLQQLVQEYSNSPEYKSDLAIAYRSLGLLLRDLNRPDEAINQYQLGISIQEKLVIEFPKVPEYQDDLAKSQNNLAMVLKYQGELQEAERYYLKAITIKEKLCAANPKSPEYLDDLSKSFNNLALLLSDLGKPEEAMLKYNQAIEIQNKLMLQYPNVPEYANALSRSYNNLGTVFDELKKVEDAETYYRKTISIREKLVLDYLDAPDYKANLASSYQNLGSLLQKTKKEETAESSFRKAITMLEELVQTFPTVPKYQSDLASNYNSLGIFLEQLNKHPAAIELFQKSLLLRERLARDYPTISRYQVDLGGSYCNFGLLICHDQPADSLQWFERAIATIRPILRSEPTNSLALQFLQNSYGNRAETFQDLKRYQEAIEDWTAAIDLTPKAEQAELRAYRAFSKRLAGQVLEAATEVSEIIDQQEWSAEQHYNFAVIYSNASAKVQEKQKLYADSAMQQLQSALQKGYDLLSEMKQNKDFDPLRKRNDFQEMLSKLETTSKKPKSK